MAIVYIDFAQQPLTSKINLIKCYLLIHTLGFVTAYHNLLIFSRVLAVVSYE
jgi:hypothetical protein